MRAGIAEPGRLAEGRLGALIQVITHVLGYRGAGEFEGLKPLLVPILHFV